MRCPFLKDANVKYCGVSGFKKMIAQVPGQAEREKCSSASFIDCPVARQRGIRSAAQSRCPFLQESQAQYCSVASVTRFIPTRELGLSRCGGENHMTCELYLAHQAGREEGSEKMR